MNMGLWKSILTVILVLPIVLSASPPNIQSLFLDVQHQSQDVPEISTAPGSSPQISTSTSLPKAQDSSSAGNLTIAATPPVRCFQNPRTGPYYNPIVLEDCFPLFVSMLLAPKFQSWGYINPAAGERKYRRQNGNCVLQLAEKGGHAAWSSGVVIAVSFAQVVNQCVRRETEYFGGEQEFANGWFAQVIAATPPGGQ